MLERLKSLYAATRPPSAEPSPSTVQGRERLCQYVGANKILTETFQRKFIYIEGDDVSISPHIMRDGVWEMWITEFLMREIRHGDTFFDIGANCGYFTLLGAQMVGPEDRVVAIEPQETLARNLHNSLSINGYLDRAAVFRRAVGDVDGEGVLNKIRDFTGSATLSPDTGFADSTETIVVNRLATIAEEAGRRWGRRVFPSVIKIDVEGYEYHAWRGMKDFLRGGSPVTIVLEFSPSTYRNHGDDPQAFVDDIRAEGFRIAVLEHDGRETPLPPERVRTVTDAATQIDLVLRKG